MVEMQEGSSPTSPTASAAVGPEAVPKTKRPSRTERQRIREKTAYANNRPMDAPTADWQQQDEESLNKAGGTEKDLAVGDVEKKSGEFGSKQGSGSSTARPEKDDEYSNEDDTPGAHHVAGDGTSGRATRQYDSSIQVLSPTSSQRQGEATPRDTGGTSREDWDGGVDVAPQAPSDTVQAYKVDDEIQAAEVQPTQSSQQPRQQRFRMFVVAFVIIVAIVVAGVVGATVRPSSKTTTDEDPSSSQSPKPPFSSSTNTTLRPTSAPTTVPSSTPTMAPTINRLEVLLSVFNRTNVAALSDPLSPQYRALDWIANYDPNPFPIVNFEEEESTAAGTTNTSPKTLEYIAERYALVTFYYSTGGDNGWWTVDDWLSEQNHCDWFGIACSGDGKIISIYLCKFLWTITRWYEGLQYFISCSLLASCLLPM